MLFVKAGRASCNGSAPNYQERILELALIICAEEVRDGDAEAAEAVHGACALAEVRDGARHAWVAAEDGGSRRGLPL